MHAVGVLATYPETTDLIELVRTLLKDHESAAMGPVSAALNIKNRSNMHDEAFLTRRAQHAQELGADYILQGTIESIEDGYGTTRLSRDKAKRLAAWHELDAPYDLAWVRAELGQAYSSLGDRDSASLEFDAALRIFRGPA